VKGKWRGGTRVGGGCRVKTTLWGAFYRASEGAERPGCEGEWWSLVGELKSMVMVRGGIGIERVVLVLGTEGLGDAWFPWRRRPEGALHNGDGQTGGGGAVIRRRKMTAWWAFVGRVAEKPPGMVQGFQAGRAQWAEMGQQAGRTGRYGGLHYEKSKERLTSGLPRIPGQTDFGPLGRIEKKFLDFDSRNEIQI
jgi:hypothetical protein